MGSVHEVIEAFRDERTNSERGTKFEELMVRFFELDPTMNRQYDSVWRWMDWPDRAGKPDTGIDLVAREWETGDPNLWCDEHDEPTYIVDLIKKVTTDSVETVRIVRGLG